MAFLDVYLDGKNATKDVPSAFFIYLVGELLSELHNVLDGGSGEASWVSDPWRFKISGIPKTNHADITLHFPGRWVAIEHAVVPLDQYCREVIQLGQRWLNYLETDYEDEVFHPEKGKIYSLFKQDFISAKEAVQNSPLF